MSRGGETLTAVDPLSKKGFETTIEMAERYCDSGLAEYTSAVKAFHKCKSDGLDARESLLAVRVKRLELLNRLSIVASHEGCSLDNFRKLMSLAITLLAQEASVDLEVV